MLHEWVDIQSNPDSAALKVKLEGDSSFLSKILFVLGGEAHDAMEVNGDTAIEHTAVFPADMDGKCGGDYTIRFLDIFSCQVMDDLTITRSKLSIQCIKSVIITFIKFSTNIYKIHIKQIDKFKNWWLAAFLSRHKTRLVIGDCNYRAGQR